MAFADSFCEVLQDLNYDVATGLPTPNLTPLIRELHEKGVYYPVATDSDADAICLGASLSGKKCVKCIFSHGVVSTIGSMASGHLPFGMPFMGIIDEQPVTNGPQHEWINRSLEDLVSQIGGRVARLPKTKSKIADLIREGDAFMRTTQKPFFIQVSSLNDRKTSAPFEPIEIPFITPHVNTSTGEGVPLSDLVSVLHDQFAASALVSSFYGVGAHLKEKYQAPNHFVTLGSLGSELPLGISLAQHNGKEVVVIQGDGSLDHSLSSLLTAARHRPANLLHIVIGNGRYDSAGEFSVLSSNCDTPELAKQLGYPISLEVGTLEEFVQGVNQWRERKEMTLLYVKCPKDLSPPQRKVVSPDPQSMKANFIDFLKREI